MVNIWIKALLGMLMIVFGGVELVTVPIRWAAVTTAGLFAGSGALLIHASGIAYGAYLARGKGGRS